MKTQKIRKMKFIAFITIFALFYSSCTNKNAQKSDIVQSLNENWQIQSSKVWNQSGKEISSEQFKTTNSYHINLPSTVLAGLVKNKVYKNIYFSNNLEKIDKKQFKSAWWYRKTFKINKIKPNNELIIRGINYKAEIWLNENLVADTNKLEGVYNQFQLNINKYLQKGKNKIAIKVFPPKKGDLTIGFVDWNPEAPDKNMGIWRGIYLKQSGIVSMKHPFIHATLNNNLDTAEINIRTELINHSKKEQKITIKTSFESKEAKLSFILRPNEKKKLNIDSKDIDFLQVSNPRLWQPNGFGSPELYKIKVQISAQNQVSDQKEIQFGIRKVEKYTTKEAYTGYKINGNKILIRGGGWVDDLLLSDTKEKVEAQVKYTKEMGLNTIRLEGFWGNSEDLYNACDKNGILLMLGWSCQWEWNNLCDRPDGPYMCVHKDDYKTQVGGYVNQVKWLRNHPSIFLWILGSDKIPEPALEKLLSDKLRNLAPNAEILASCKVPNSEVSGATGVKMLGPYAYESPNYWYIDKNYGGAYGFNTETGPGPQVPPLASLKKMLPNENLWPIDSIWNYHCGRHTFKNLNFFMNAYNKRYGKAQNIEEFAYKVQLSNYEAIRGMYEAFAVNKFKATGVITWMLNSAWPEMFWQLYDWYLMPTGAYFGTKAACQKVHAIYNYGDKNIYVTNETLKKYKNLQISIKLIDINSNSLLNDSLNFDLEKNSSQLVYKIPKLKNLSDVYFLQTNIKTKKGEILSHNFYWLSKKEDVLDFKNSQWFKTPFKSFADFSSLNQLKKARVSYEIISSQNGKTKLKLSNTSKVLAFGIELQLINKATNKPILPVYWSDNYISLLPSESREIEVKYEQTVGLNTVIKLNGLNIK